MVGDTAWGECLRQVGSEPLVSILIFLFRLVPMGTLGTVEPLPSALQWRIQVALERYKRHFSGRMPWTLGSDRKLQYGILPR